MLNIPPVCLRAVKVARRCIFLISIFVFAGPLVVAAIQSPEQYFGHAVGAEKKLIGWDGITGYLQELSRKSDRIQIHELGKSTENNAFILAVISSPDNLKKIEQYKRINSRLFDPRTVPTDAEARQLVQNGKIFVLVTCSIHSNEIGASQMSVELAYTLATGSTPRIQTILENVIFLLVPSVNPDGQILITDWYNKTVGTPNEDAPLPWLFHPYVGHDNNRDSYMFTQKETQLIGKVLYQDWLPAVWLDLHQMGSEGPRVFVMPAMDPINPNVDPLIYRNAGLLGFSQAAALEREGKNGIIYGDVYTYWWEGAMAWAGLWHNMIGLLTEVASAKIAGTVEQEKAGPVVREAAEELPGSGAALPAPVDLQPRLHYPQPWTGGKWSLRDIVDYEFIATLGLLESSAQLRTQLLESLYVVGKRQIELGQKGEPFAVLVPKDQADRPTAIKLLQTLAYAGIEVHRAKHAFSAEGREYPSGTYVILMSQPFRAYVKDMLEPQVYPAAASSSMEMTNSPYDITGWSLGMQMGVETVFIAKPFKAELEKLAGIGLPPGSVSGSGSSYVLSHEPNNSIVAVNRLLKQGFDISWLSEAAYFGGKSFPPGAIVVRGGTDLGPAIAGITGSLGIDAVAVKFPFAEAMRIRAPRTALYQPWGGNMDEGWTRWLLEQNEFPFTTVRPQDVRKGDLLKKFDVIIFPDMTSGQIISGITERAMPDGYRGGIEKAGLRALKYFMEKGGTVIALGQSSSFLMDEFGAPFRNSLRGLRRESFLCPGSILRILVDNTHPIGYGMKSEASGYFINSLALEAVPQSGTSRSSVVVRYPESDVLKSGWLRGESYLQNKIAAAEVKLGRGRMILLPLRVQHRAQSYDTFKLLFNSILTSASEPSTDLQTARR